MIKYEVIVPLDVHPYPESHETSAALILARYFCANAKFVRRSMTIKSPDLEIAGVEWELKSPVGKGKRTFQNNLRKANRQCANVVLDLRRYGMPTKQAVTRAREAIAQIRSIKRLLIITKAGKVLVIK